MAKLLKCKFCDETRKSLKNLSAHVKENHKSEWAKFRSYMGDWEEQNKEALDPKCNICEHRRENGQEPGHKHNSY